VPDDAATSQDTQTANVNRPHVGTVSGPQTSSDLRTFPNGGSAKVGVN